MLVKRERRADIQAWAVVAENAVWEVECFRRRHEFDHNTGLMADFWMDIWREELYKRFRRRLQIWKCATWYAWYWREWGWKHFFQ